MADERSNEPGQAMTTEQKRLVQKVGKVMPDAKIHAPKENGKYYGAILFADKNFVVQQVGEKTVVAHPRESMGQLPLEPGRALGKLNGTVVDVNYTGKDSSILPADPERWHERTNRTPAAEMHASVARSHLGENVGVYNPPSQDAGLSPRYEGVVVAVNDTHLIQRINSRTAIVHEVSDETAKRFGVGEVIAVKYDNGKLLSVEPHERQRSQEQRAERQAPERESASRDPEDAARAKSFNLARNVTRHNYGKDSKIYLAERLDVEQGKYRGPVVAMTDHHVMQRVGKDRFVAHNRGDLQGELGVGKFVEVTYAQKRAQVMAAQRRADRARDQQQPEQNQQRKQSRGPGLSR